MSTEFLVAVLGFLGTLTGTLSGILLNTKLTSYCIEQLEKKVDKHNHVVDRVYKIEQHLAVIEEDMKVVNHRLEDLEEYHK